MKPIPLPRRNNSGRFGRSWNLLRKCKTEKLAGTTSEVAENLVCSCRYSPQRTLPGLLAYFYSRILPWLERFCRHSDLRYSPAGTSFTIRTRLWAAAVSRNNQSIRPRPRSLVWRNPATVLIQLNTFSMRRRILWLLANRGCCRSASLNQFFQFFDALNSATKGTTPKARIPTIHFSSL